MSNTCQAESQDPPPARWMRLKFQEENVSFMVAIEQEGKKTFHVCKYDIIFKFPDGTVAGIDSYNSQLMISNNFNQVADATFTLEFWGCGVIGDDVGMGKSITTLKLLKSVHNQNQNEEKKQDENKEKKKESQADLLLTGWKMRKATLLLCPELLVDQWLKEGRPRLPHTPQTQE